MPAEVVLDASVAAKCFFEEVESDLALGIVRSGARLLAPEFIHAEFASIAAKKVRRGEVARETAADAIVGIARLVAEVFPGEVLAGRAFSLAVETGCSAYDGLYLSLAEARGCQVVTADERLVRRASAAGLAHLVESLRP